MIAGLCVESLLLFRNHENAHSNFYVLPCLFLVGEQTAFRSGGCLWFCQVKFGLGFKTEAYVLVERASSLNYASGLLLGCTK